MGPQRKAAVLSLPRTLAGGWEPEQHSLFVAGRVRARKAALLTERAGGAPAVSALEELALLLPGRSLQEIRAHEQW